MSLLDPHADSIIASHTQLLLYPAPLLNELGGFPSPGKVPFCAAMVMNFDLRRRDTLVRMNECLIVGPEGAGKTLLVRKLEEYSKGRNESDGGLPTENNNYASIASQAVQHTVPTVGINLAQIYPAKGVVCSLRESGGQMAPLWHNECRECTMLIYVVDSSHRVQVSETIILLLDLLSSKQLAGKPVLIFFNKTDSPLGMGLVEYKSVMRLDEVVSHADQTVTVLEGSCWTGEGIGDILQWLTKNCSKSR